MLVSGAAPSAVAKNLESTLWLICPSAAVEELSNVDYMRKLRRVMRIPTVTLAYY